MDYSNLVFSLKEEAEKVLTHMTDILDQYSFVSVGDLRDLAGLPKTYLDDVTGWTDLKEAEIKERPEGFELALPEPKQQPDSAYDLGPLHNKLNRLETRIERLIKERCMKRSVALEAVTDAVSITLVQSLDPEFIGEEYAGKANELRELFKQETGVDIFDNASALAELSIDALEKAGLVFDPEGE